MYNQTDQMERPERAGHAGKLASRVGSGGTVRAGESPAASTHFRYCTRCDGRQRTTSRAEPCTRCGGSGYEPGVEGQAAR